MKTLSYFLKLLSFGLLIFIWDYTFISYRNLPKIIPIHFDFAGNPDGYGQKMVSWLFPLVATLVFGFLLYLSKNAKSPLLNLPHNIKEKPLISRLITDGLNILVMSLFSVITYDSIAVALGENRSLSPVTKYLLGFLFLYVAFILLYSYILKKKNNLTDIRR